MKTEGSHCERVQKWNVSSERKRARLSQCSFFFLPGRCRVCACNSETHVQCAMCTVHEFVPRLFSACTISPGKEFGYANNRAKLFAAVRISGTPCTSRRGCIHKCIRMSADGRVYKCIRKFAATARGPRNQPPPRGPINISIWIFPSRHTDDSPIVLLVVKISCTKVARLRTLTLWR